MDAKLNRGADRCLMPRMHDPGGRSVECEYINLIFNFKKFYCEDRSIWCPDCNNKSLYYVYLVDESFCPDCGKWYGKPWFTV